MKIRIFKLLALVCALAFVWSGWQLLQLSREYRAAEQQYSELEQFISLPEPAPTPEPVPAPAPEPQEPTPELPAQPAPEVPEPPAPTLPQVDFAALGAINPDTVAWLIIEGTKVNYPVVQGDDNDFYLTHQFDGSYNKSGCLFLDAAQDPAFGGSHQIIYGHYMNNRSMFYDLMGYKEQRFFEEHPTGWLVTPDKCWQVRFFSGYVTDVSGGAWETGLTEGERETWLADRVKKSSFRADVAPTAADSVLTLSTCSYEFQDARFVLHGILTEP